MVTEQECITNISRGEEMSARMPRNMKAVIFERFDKLRKRGRMKISTIVSVTKQLREHRIKWKKADLCQSCRAVIVTF